MSLLGRTLARIRLSPLGKRGEAHGSRVPCSALCGSLDTGQDNLAIIPYTTHQVVFNIDVTRPLRGGDSFGGIIGILPRDDAPKGQALAEVEEIMRIRHGLKLDEPNDFDIITQDALLRTWEQISRAVLLALVVISSIALMVGGIGVMAIMMISVTERTREIGVRKALGARRSWLKPPR